MPENGNAVQLRRINETESIGAASDRRYVVMGYGNQGRVHALNLRDSGLSVEVAARPGRPGATAAAADGFTVHDLDAGAAAADCLILGLPDEAHADAWEHHLRPHLRPGATLGFMHGYAIRYGLIEPPPGLGIILVAPKGPGPTLRDRFLRGQGIPCLHAVYQDSARADAALLADAWAAGLGCVRAGVIETTFAHEAETDLFGEQAVLCGGVLALVTAAFETLREAGYPDDLAYIEACHELKQVVDLIYAHGLDGMAARISNTAEFGAFEAGTGRMAATLRPVFDALLADIRDGTFAGRFRADYAAGRPWLEERRRRLREHPVTAAGERVRALMPWLADDDDVHAGPTP